MARRRRSALDNPVSTEAIDTAASIHKHHVQTTSASSETSGLKLTPIKRVPTTDLTPSPFNTVFDDVKNPEYWSDLEQDIREANAITDPLIATTDNVLLSGHSRLYIARKLLNEGNQQFVRVPVRYIQNPITDQERKQRVYLSNLNRFEIDPDTRIRLRAELYPGYYNDTARKAGRKRGARESPNSTTPETSPSAANIAHSNKTSARNIQREKDLHLKASRIAREDGRAEPTNDDYRKARAITNSERKQQRKQKNRTQSFSETRIRKSLSTYEERCSSDEKRDGAREFVEMLVGSGGG